MPTAGVRSFSNTDDVVVDDDDDAAAATEDGDDDDDISDMEELEDVVIAVFIDDVIPMDTKPLARLPVRLPAPRKRHKPYRDDMRPVVQQDAILWIGMMEEREREMMQSAGLNVFGITRENRAD